MGPFSICFRPERPERVIIQLSAGAAGAAGAAGKNTPPKRGSPVMTVLRIGKNSPFRRAFDGLDQYYNSKSELVDAVSAALDAYNDSPKNKGREVEIGFHDMEGCEGYNTWALRPKNTDHAICECCLEKSDRVSFNNVLVITHYEMRPGRWEFVVYVSI
jgi:hypothetical protein